LEFDNPEALMIDPDAVTVLAGNAAQATTITLEPVTLAVGEQDVTLKLNLPEGYKINDLVDSRLMLRSDSNIVRVNPAPSTNEATIIIASTELTAPITLATGTGQMDAELTLYYCREGEEALCFIETATYQIPVTVTDDADPATVIIIEREIVPPSDF
jgi:hypothetical protein